MLPVDYVTDSTDWLATPLASLAAVEAALRCQVCKDFYKTPMITSCSHTFCSICIRRALSNDGKCPLCRAPEQELKLRSNWSMEETVDVFSKARPAVLKLARKKTENSTSPKRKVEESGITESTLVPEPKRQRTSARLSSQQKYNMSANSPRPDPRKEVLPASDEDESSNHDDEDGYKDDAENAHNLVPCPSCQNNMKAWQVFQHLEACPGPNSQTTSSEIVRNSAALQIPQLRHHKTVERLPALNYSMLKEQALRKKLAEMGISNQGPRILLEQRHREWITIWNANCDSAQPRNRQQLLQDLDVWEKTQGYRSTTAGRTPSSIIAIKDKKFDGTAWAARHDSSFKDLIASARKSRMNIKPSFKYEDERGEKVESLPHDLTTKRRGLFMDMDKTKNPALELQGHLLTSGELLNDVGSHPDMANEELLDQ